MNRHSYATFIVGLIATGVLLASSAAAQRANPSDMKRSPDVQRPGPVDPRIVGAWDVWISGAVTYSTDGRSVYRHYEPGAAMNRLEIASDGRYSWGGKTGRVVEVLPWHHQPGRRYYRVVHSGGSEYDFYYSDGDRLVLLFGGVGGHASTGTRITGGATSAPPAGPPVQAGERVEVEWKGQWLPARVLKVEAGRSLISYDGYGSSWDEWVTPARIRPPGTGTRQSAPPPTGQGGRQDSTNPTASTNSGGKGSDRRDSEQRANANPLGVEWVGGGRANGSASPQPSGNNPLGVEWVGSGNARPEPVHPTPARPAGPSPSSPAPASPAPTRNRDLATALTDRWLYQAVAFVDGTGTVSESRGVSGSLVFKSDGSYEQALSIGGILNAIRGSYRVMGGQITMNFQWGGKASTDVLTIHLDDSGDNLALVRQGSPTAYYTLRRAK